jgi:DNA repair protein RecO (recombination protein O)
VPEGRLIPHHDEAIVLRTWPFHEADLLVSLFTRRRGKVKGVARHAMKSRRRFGGALEPATQVLAHYTERPREDLVRMDSFEIMWSPLTASVDALRVAGMQLVVEVIEEAMPELAAEDNVFRLAVAVLREMQISDHVYIAVTYFGLWMARLMGWWPELGHCAVCGLDLRGQDVWWSPVADGVTCAEGRRPQSRRVGAAAVAESYRITRASLEQVTAHVTHGRELYGELGVFAVAVLERHLERRLRSAAAL